MERDYTRIFEKQRALGPNLADGTVGAHGIAVNIAEQYEELKARNGVIRSRAQGSTAPEGATDGAGHVISTTDDVGAGCPSIEDAYQACQAVLTMSSATNAP